jgi:peroxiredoxin
MIGSGLRPQRFLSLLGLVVLTAIGAGRTESPDPKAPPAPAAKIEPFTLPAADGKPWTLPDAKQAPLVVVVFTGTACPINTAYFPTLAKLHKEYGGRGVAFVAVNSNVNDDAKTVAAHAKANGLPFPVLKDDRQTVADRFGAKLTPEAFLLDASRVVRYRGRIDDQFGFGYKRTAPTRRDLAEAIDELLAGKAVSKPAVAVEGCDIARAPEPKADATVTFSKDVARILQKNCQECHRPGQVGPMPLIAYDDAAAWAETIRRVVKDGRMPPWHADPHFGSFTNVRGLSAAEKQTLLAWIDQGCAPGDPKDLPPAKEFAEGWRIGQPDLVVTMPKAYKVPADGGPRGVAYRYFPVKTNFDRDMWVQAAEAKPGARAVVHHIVVFVTMSEDFRQNSEDRAGDGFLVGYAPGDMPSVFPAGQAKKIPKGATLLFQMHYTPNGTAQEDRSSLGLIFAKEPPKYEVRSRGVMNPRFEIPAGDADYKVEAASTFRKDALLVNLLPHMHLRGKSFRYEAVFPDGRRETLLSVPKYDFNWQSNYRLTEPLTLPAGTRIECTAHYDNSAANKNNPDPNEPVRWGDQTWEEMMVGFVDYVYLPEKK